MLAEKKFMQGRKVFKKSLITAGKKLNKIKKQAGLEGSQQVRIAEAENEGGNREI